MKRPVVVIGVVLLIAAPAATALRLHASVHSVSLSGGYGQSIQGGQKTSNVPRPGKAVPGRLAKPTVDSSPTQRYLRKARSAVFDVRSLKSTVVKRERPEVGAPGEADAAPAATLPPSVSRKTITTANAPAPAPDLSFDGLDFANWGAGHPPDTNGDVGPNYYIQTVNTSIGIYDKSNGNRVAAFTFNALMSQGHFGNLCDTDNFGDPVVLYDSFEDRWFITDFAFKLDGSGNVAAPAFQCFAVSKTGDPVNGGWNFYSIQSPGALNDYPKFGVWPDGIYMSANMFGFGASGTFQSPHVWAIDKQQMYAGAPTVQVVDFAAPSSEFTMLPANARLQTGTPPAGSPNYFAVVWQFLNAISVYKFHVDWDKPSTSTFTGPFTSTDNNWWEQLASGNQTAPTPANRNDELYARLMVQNQYTNIGGVESLWDSHTVGAGNPGATNVTATQSGVRFYQTKVTGGTVEAAPTQAWTYSPDSTLWRYMPSVAADRLGDMAIGYSTSNSTTNPALKYAGRLAGDPPNSITQDEQTLFQGTGAQSGNCGSSACTRWGDYSAMTLDPNGCEFWYTNEYYATNGLNDLTRVGAFKLNPACTSVGNGTLSGTVTDGTNPIAGATVALGNRTTTTDGSGNYSFTVPAGTYASETADKPGFNTGTASTLVVPDGGTLTKNFTLSAAAQSGCFTDNTQSAFQRGTPSNCDLVSSPGNVVLSSGATVDQQNTNTTSSGFAVNSTSWAGQTFTAGKSGSLTQVDLDLFCSSCTGTAPNIAVSLRATSGGLPTGSDLATATIPGFTSGSGGFFSAVFSTPAHVTAGTQYAVIFHPVANPSAGTYAYVVSSSSVYSGGSRATSANSGSTWAADATRDLGFKTYVDAGFASSGTFVSSLKDANPNPGSNATWTTLTFSATQPAGTSVKFQVAGSNSQYGPFNFVGPDGTANTFFTTSGADLSQFDNFRYLKYEAFLTTNSGSVSPSLQSVSVCFADVSPSTATTLAVDPASGTFGGTTALSATLTGGGPVAGKTVAFTINGSSAGSAVTNASGVATVTGVSLAGINAGSYPSGVGATFAGDGTYAASSGSAALTVAKADQTITVTTHAPASDPYAATFFVAANASSGLAVSYSSGGSCANSGTAFTITSGSGTCTVKYDQAGNANYNAAPQVTESVTAQKANQTITVSVHAPASAGYNAGFAVSATTSSGLGVTYGSSGVCSNIGTSYTMTSGSGSCTVSYDQPGNGNYNPAPQVTESVTATKGSQAINITQHAPANATFNAQFTVAAAGGGSGNPVTFSSAGSCSNTGATFTMNSGTGTCTVKYDQAGDSNYDAAPEVTESVTAQKASQTITVNSHAPSTAPFNSSFDVAATGGASPNPIVYSSAGSCTNSGSHFTVSSGTGTCTVKYDQAGDANYNAATEVTESVTAQKANQAITVDTHAPSSAVYGTSFDVAATGGGSGNPVTYSSAGGCSNSGGHFTMTSGTTTCSVKYDQAGSADYNPAPQVVETVTAQKADQTINVSVHAPTSAGYNSGFNVSATATSALAVSYGSAGSCSNIGGSYTMTSGSGSCTVTYDQAGDTNYNPAPQVTEAVTATKGGQAINVTTHAPLNAVYGTSFDVAATGGGSGNPVTYASAGACSNSGAHFTITSGSGTCTVKYDQAGDSNYDAAPEVTESVTAQKASQTISVTTHAPASAVYGSSFSVAATGGGSGNPVTFSSAGSCSNSGATFTITSGSGTCTVKYDQAGNTNYAAASQVTDVVTAQKANQTISVTTHAPASAVNKSTFTVAASASSGLPVSYSSAGSCTNSGATFTITKPSGTCTVKYDQAGNANVNAAPQVTESVAAKPQQKKRPLLTLCFKRRTVRVTPTEAKTLRKHGAKLGTCKPTAKKKR